RTRTGSAPPSGFPPKKRSATSKYMALFSGRRVESTCEPAVRLVFRTHAPIPLAGAVRIVLLEIPAVIAGLDVPGDVVHALRAAVLHHERHGLLRIALHGAVRFERLGDIQGALQSAGHLVRGAAQAAGAKFRLGESCVIARIQPVS